VESSNPWDRIHALGKVAHILKVPYLQNPRRQMDQLDRKLIKGFYRRTLNEYRYLDTRSGKLVEDPDFLLECSQRSNGSDNSGKNSSSFSQHGTSPLRAQLAEKFGVSDRPVISVTSFIQKQASALTAPNQAPFARQTS